MRARPTRAGSRAAVWVLRTVALSAPLALVMGRAEGAPPPRDERGPAPLSAELRCERAARPGRVLCELELEVKSPWSIQWADALVVEAPEFAPPLRARVVSKVVDSRRATVAIALVALRPGRGELLVRGRAAVCPGVERRACRSAERRASAELFVSAGDEP